MALLKFGMVAIPLILSLIMGGKAEEWGTTHPEDLSKEGEEVSTTSIAIDNDSLVVDNNWTRPPHAHLEIDMIFNVTDIDDVVDLVTDFHFMTFILSLACAIAWVIYIIFYHSRIMGLVFTQVANLFIKEGYVSIGSISIAVLSGKIMFREVAYITEDFSWRIQDGWVIFRWWKSYAPKDISEDVSDSDTRLSMSMNGLECHLYNRCELYSRLENFFGLDSGISSGDGNNNGDMETNNRLPNGKANNQSPNKSEGDEYSWRDLVPAVKMEISRGRIVFGNMLIPHTIALVIDEAKLIYTTKTATSRLDKFMHVVQGRAEHLKLVLSQSPKYSGPKDEPPRLMGEGFSVITSNKVEYLLYMDEPGLVPHKNVENDTDENTHPKYGADIKCGKGTNFNYGPWAERQRDHLHKLFFPQDYQEKIPTPAPLPGEIRQTNSLDIKVSLKNDSKINLLFNKDQETKVIHVNVGYGTQVEMIIPWVIGEDGYTTKITGQFNKLKSSTSLQYRNLLESECLQFSLASRIPIHWNEHQEWLLNLTGQKTSASFTFAHKWFLQAFVNDWLSRSPRPDILNFVPYTWKIKACLEEFEVIIPVSEYNWIDCSSQDYNQTENELLAAYGERIDLTMDLPFTEFLPDTVPIYIKVQLENGFLSFFVPPVSTAFVAIQSLSKTAKIRNVDGHGGHFLNKSGRDHQDQDDDNGKGTLGRLGGNTKYWMKCQPSKNWVECGSVPNCVINVRFTYHPMPPLGPKPVAALSLEEKEDILLDPIRIPPGLEKISDAKLDHSDFDPASLSPDLVQVDVEVGSGELLLYGSLLKIIINWKETIFGDHQQFIDMEILRARADKLTTDKSQKTPKGSGLNGDENVQSSSLSPKAVVDCRNYRPLHVNVSVIANNILAHLLKHCNEDDPPCPTVFVNKIGFELDKRYQETRLQVLASPAMIRVSDTFDRSESGDEHLGDGHLMLSGLQVRGHSMFSNEGRNLDEDTLEYAFLLEIQLGRLSGRLSTPHLENILSAVQCLILPVLDVENSLKSPHSFLPCHHGNNQFDCDDKVSAEGQKEGSQPASPRVEPFPSGPAFPAQRDPGDICPTSEDIKYGMLRLSLDAVDLYVVEGGTASSLWVSPIRLAKCNLHGQLSREGCTLLIPNVLLRHFVMISPAYTKRFRFSDASAMQGPCEPLRSRPSITGENSWLEVGSVGLGPLCLEVGLRGSSQLCQTQRKFLVAHDMKTRRLWFLWNSGSVPRHDRKCGCAGGCIFFGSNSGGSTFHQPSEKDWMNGVNVACFQVNKPGEDPGFGQSILKEEVLLFDTPPYTRQGADDNPQPPLTSTTHHQFQANRRKLWSERNRLSDYKQGQPDFPKDRRSMDEKLLKYLENNDKRQSHTDRSIDDSLDSLSDFDSLSSSLLNVQDPMINLQMHLNKPITESSVLMPCYLNHLSQLKCDNWNMTAPKCGAKVDSIGIASIAKVQDGKITHLRCKHIPCFEPVLDGFTNLTMTNRQANNLGQHDMTPKSVSNLRRRLVHPSQMTQSFDFPASGVRFSDQNPTSNDPPPTLPTEEFYQAVLNCGWEEDFDVPTSSERTTFVIRTENDVNVMASPMLLEAIQKLVEAITPTLSSLHPLTVVNNLHGDCLSQVEGENLLKKEKSEFLTRLYKSKGNTVLREQATVELTLNQSILYEQTLQTTIQGSVSIPKVNLTLLQASVVEDVVSFSALDNVRDLMCVSMMAVAIENTKVYLLYRGHEKKTVQVLRRPTIVPKLEKKRGWRSKVAIRESILDEPVFSENSEKQTEFVSMSVDISRVHGQLRRLKNDSSILKEAVITAIPNQNSRVLFRFSKIPSCLMTQSSAEGPLHRQDATVEEPQMKFTSSEVPASQVPQNIITSDDKLGFIMFECGLEGISFKGVKNDDSLGEKYRKTLKKNETASVTIFNELVNDTSPGGATPDPTEKEKETNVPNGMKDEDCPPKSDSERTKGKEAGIASCVIKLKSMWNNFAAPPRSPITKKIDCTKADWNLVSTTSTAINAWLNPINQLTLAIGTMQRGYSRRTTGLLASMMADAIGIQSIHHHQEKSKYNKLTPMAKTLLEDPSCQLCLVLRRYIARTEMETIERNMTESELPQLSTLRQGVIVMSRQWKNELYTPLLLEHNLRSPKKSKHFSVTFADSDTEGTDGESENDMIDELTKLLDVEEGTRGEDHNMGHPRSMEGQRHFSSDESREENLLLEAHTQFPQHPGLTLLDSHVIFKPLLTGMGLMPHQIIGYSFDQLGSHVSFKAAVELLRIDIVESEGKVKDKKSKKEFNFVLNVPPDMPTFLCQNIGFEGDFQRSADMESDVLNRRNMIRMSRNYWKKQAKSSIIFSINIGCISQQVNMPLLRLVHQISTTFLNVKETQGELKKQMPLINDMHGDRSSSSSSSDNEADAEPNEKFPESSGESSVNLQSNLQAPTSGSPKSRRISSSIIERTQSFAQRLKKKDRKSKVISGGSVTSDNTPQIKVSPPAPNCWRTIYYLLDIYAARPETKAVTLKTPLSSVSFIRRTRTPAMMSNETPRVSVFGIACIQRTRLLASLSGLKLEAEIKNLQASSSYKNTLPMNNSGSLVESSLTGHIGQSTIVLLEGIAPEQKTVVSASIGQSEMLYSSQCSSLKESKNSALLTVGPITIDIPQHPVVLHGMMTRSRNRLSTTLQEFRVNRAAARISKVATVDEVDFGHIHTPQGQPGKDLTEAQKDTNADMSNFKCFQMNFTVALESLGITAALLPSLQAKYKMEMIRSCGVTGNKIEFGVRLPVHSLSFTTKLTMDTEGSSLPSSACINFPQIDMNAEYIREDQPEIGEDKPQLAPNSPHPGSYLSANVNIDSFEHSLSTDLLNHLVFVQKVFRKEVNEVVLKMSGGEKPPQPVQENQTVEIASGSILFDFRFRLQGVHITATTPTNTAVRLETGLLKFKVSNRDKPDKKNPEQNPNPHNSDHTPNQDKVFVKGHVAVNLSLGQFIKNPIFEEAEPEYQQYAFFKTHVGLKNMSSGSSSPSSIPASLPNPGEDKDKKIVIVTVTRPLIYVQPIAVDKAILVWLNYKTAFDYWNEQRGNLTREVNYCTSPSEAINEQPLWEPDGDTPPRRHRHQAKTSPEAFPSSMLFLKLKVDDLGISVPLNPSPLGLKVDAENRGAIVVTLKKTSISACSSGSLVSKGTFSGLCIRFTEDMFGMDDWMPNLADPDLMNVCLVSEGTYDFCSRTTSMKSSGGKNPELFLNVQWQMEGVDMHVDGNIGKQLSALGYTLTTLAAFDQDDDADEEEEPNKSMDVPDSAQPVEPVMLRKRRSSHTDNQGFLTVPNVSRRKKKSLQEMHERISMIEDLDRAGTARNQVEEERKKLEDLQNEASRDFKRELFKKLRRQSTVRRSGSPENFNRDAQRSKSLVAKPNSDKLSEWRQHKSKTVVPVVEVGFDKEWSRGNTEAGQDEIDSAVPLTIQIGQQDPLPGGEQMTGASSMSSMKPEEPNVNLILDVKVFINSGKCVLHAKTKSNEEDKKVSPQEKKRRWRSGSGYGSLFSINSPTSISRNGKQYLSSPKLKSPIGIPPGFLTDVTIFRIPGLDVKIHYGSQIMHDTSDQGMSTPSSSKHKMPIGKPTFTQRLSHPGSGSCPGTKRASMFAWITLHSVPEETVISPHILDFLDQTLAAMPVIQPNANLNPKKIEAEASNDNGKDEEDGVTITSYETFPVDVVVYFHMKSSTFRFSCQPVSRMECVLRLPSLDIVFSSKGEEEEYEYERKEIVQTIKTPHGHGLRHRKSAAFAAPSPQSSSIVVGFSLTGCLSDFSLNIFHPYGAAAKKVSNWSPLSDNERKDSVSVNVEFVKFHLSRRRKEHFKSVGLSSMNLPTAHEAAIHFSTIIDIGSASLKYDMRRLTEILAFPKAWYRRSLVRRVFLGKMSTTPVAGDDIKESPAMKNEGPAGMKRQASTQSGSLSALETLLLFTVNFTKLNVQMNMGNVMGNVDWLIRDATSEGKLSIGSAGHKNLYIGVGLNSSYIKAKGGIVAGTIELSKLTAYLKGREDPGVEPQHTVGLQLHSLELELDYMGSSALMGRASGLQIKLKDEWKVQEGIGAGRHSVLATYRPATIYIHGDMGWDQFQLIISKSSTVDLFKMYYKLEEFFKQQFRSSKWVLGNMLHDASSDQLTPTTKRRLEDSTKNILQVEPRRHWQQALDKVSKLWIRSISIPFPESGAVLGGTMNLHGNNISLACFHGLNFKAKNWALFSVKQPVLSFSTEAQETRQPEGGQGTTSGGVHVIQNLNFSLGQQNTNGMGGSTVEPDCRAIVCKITRNVMHAPQFRTLYEWFHYAFAPSEIDDVSRFPSLEMERAELRSPIHLPDPNHNKEVIFALPSMELFFKTEQLQDTSTDPASKKPVVECSFITEFGDHIFVSVDVEAFLFLHDLILSYIKEKDKMVSAQLAGGRGPTGRRLGSSLTPPPSPNMDRDAKIPRDWRDYHCKTWHLEPTVRLRSWAGKAIEPYGVDYILQKLGFSHARVTIPKWIQRGFCDPLDQALSLLIFGMVDFARRKETAGKDSSPNSS